MAGAPQPGYTLAETEAAYIRNLCYSAEQFEKEGLMGLIEPLCKQVLFDSCSNIYYTILKQTYSDGMIMINLVVRVTTTVVVYFLLVTFINIGTYL